MTNSARSVTHLGTMSAFGETALGEAQDAERRALDRREVPSFDAVYDSTAELVWRALARFGVPADAVEDAVQEVFLVVHKRLGTFEGRSSVKTWVYAIAVHVARTQRRTTARRALSPASASQVELETLREDPRRGPDALLEKAQATFVLSLLLDQLDPDFREVFVLAELEEMTAMEIADVLGISPNTVSSRLRLARRDFDKALTRVRARDEWRIR